MADVIKIATRDAYGQTLIELGDERQDIVVMDADLAAATKTGMFKKAHPDRFFNAGIAEGNMMSIAAGLAAAGAGMTQRAGCGALVGTVAQGDGQGFRTFAILVICIIPCFLNCYSSSECRYTLGSTRL